jgi:hypothetical protein
MSWQAVHSWWGMGSGGGVSPRTAILGCRFLPGVLGGQAFDMPVRALQPRSAEDPEWLSPPDSTMSLDGEPSFKSGHGPALASALATAHQACRQHSPGCWGVVEGRNAVLEGKEEGVRGRRGKGGGE